MNKHKEDLKFGLNAENIVEEELKKYFKGVRKKKVKNLKMWNIRHMVNQIIFGL